MPEDTFRWVITGAVAVSTLCIFIMAVVALVMYRVVAKMQARAEGVIERVEPLLDTAKQLVRENGPKFSAIATRVTQIVDNAKDISDVARDQAHNFAEVGRDYAEVGRDIAHRAKAQVAKVDAAVDDTVDQVHNAGNNIKEAALKPVREANGVLAGIKAAVSTYAQGRRPGVERIAQDEEMFI
jgi:ABC-type transporter Mla subunit MlaD